MKVYYYAELNKDNTLCLAYKGLTKNELKKVIANLQKDVDKYDIEHTFIFGRVSNLKNLGSIGELIYNNAISYQADVMQLIINTAEYYQEHPDDME